MNINPIIKLDYPDIDVIRVDDTYYMLTTTMYFFPGCEILRSYDLVNWEHASFVFETLDNTKGQRLDDGIGIYGQGMWAASLRYHNGTFYIVFVCNDTHKTYLYRSESINGPWKKSNIKGFYHDSSLLFDDDGRIYIVYGNREIHLTELDANLTGPKDGGIDKIIVRDSDEAPLGYEGSHFYKINGKYYVFFIHILIERWMRVESCFVSDSIDGPYVGGDIFENDLGYHDSGAAQGGIVDTPDGKWYAILFQDMGAVGRIPVLVSVSFENDLPVFSTDSIELHNPKTVSLRPGYNYAPLADSDNFSISDGPSFGHRSIWQFNHEPDLSFTKLDPVNHTWSVTSDRVVSDILAAKNTITQRLYYPETFVQVTVDASMINDGDYAGLAVLQSAYAFVAITKENNAYYLVRIERISHSLSMTEYDYETLVTDKIPIDNPVQTISFHAVFEDMKDEVTFSVGSAHKMHFKLDHFTGNRAGLFIYSTRKAGGCASFSDFILKR